MQMGFIKNKRQLIDHGNASLRKTALEIIEYTLARANPYTAASSLVRLDGECLEVGHLRFDLQKHNRIFLLGAGKATYPIAKALDDLLDDLLDDRITDGVVVCKYGQQGELTRCGLLLAAHPIPDEAGMKGAREALALAERTGPGDIVFACITGGSSALWPLPVKGITLEEKKQVNRLLLSCGANIIEINAVRKHLSQIKGGRLARAIHPQAHLINLTVSDVIGDPLDYITDPTVPDTSTFDDARATLTKYDLWSKVPSPVAQFLKNADENQETPKVEDLSDYQRDDFILVPGAAACNWAEKKAAELGFKTMILSTMLEGESSEVGRTFAALAKEIVLKQRPIVPPCAVIGGGETTVIIDEQAGTGGPNQEFALSAAFDIADLGNVIIAGIDSDGTDGPTQMAGAIVDDQTFARARTAGLDLYARLKDHDVTYALQELGDVIETGATGTNVNDLKLLLVLPQST